MSTFHNLSSKDIVWYNSSLPARGAGSDTLCRNAGTDHTYSYPVIHVPAYTTVTLDNTEFASDRGLYYQSPSKWNTKYLPKGYPVPELTSAVTCMTEANAAAFWNKLPKSNFDELYYTSNNPDKTYQTCFCFVDKQYQDQCDGFCKS